MSYEFDDLARAIARGISRREALKRMGSGLAALFLASIGVRRAQAAVTCGTCQTCDLDTNTCGLPCTPASAGSSLCTMASSDGSYLRLVSYLTINGFVLAGVSDSVLLYKSGSLFQSGMLTNFNNPAVSGETAVVTYAVSPQGSITSFAVVAQNGAPIYGLSVDFNGSIVQTIATQTQSANPSANAGKAQASARGSVKPIQQPLALVPRTASREVMATPALIPGLSPQVCDYIVGILCGLVSIADCYIIGAALCAAESLLTLLFGAPECALAVMWICGAGYTVACAVGTPEFCDCAFNTQYCNGVCCGPCQDCSPTGACVPANNVAACPSKVCCNGQCCAEGLICDPTTNMCASPNSGCFGATCEDYIGCNGNDECFCGTIEGGTLCQVSTACAPLALCPDGFCAPGSVCLYGSCCGEPVCVPLSVTCPSSASLAERRSAAARLPKVNGPTTGHR